MSDPSPNCPHIYRAIAAVQSDLAASGIAKNEKNQQSNYKYRGIDALYNVLGPSLAKNNLVILPRVLSRIAEERQTKGGGAISFVVVTMEFDLVSTLDGSKHVTCMVGEGMDVSDKATNKAETAAYKYMCFQAFCIPVEGEMDDADGQTWETRHRQEPRREPQRETRPREEAPRTPAPQQEQRKSAPAAATDDDGNIKVKRGENGTLHLTGKGTYAIKDRIRANGGRWVKDHWEMSPEDFEKLVDQK